MISKVQLAGHIIDLRTYISRWITEGAFKDDFYTYEAQRLLDSPPLFADVFDKLGEDDK